MALDCARLVKPAKKLLKLLRKIDRDPSPEQVHGLRTNVRRFEASFRALALDEEGLDNSIVKQLNRLRKRAGKVRDMDVLTGFATKVHLQGEDECHVRLLEHLGSRRKKYAVKLHDEAKHLRRKCTRR
jgi:CHAD domain-containing protein